MRGSRAEHPPGRWQPIKTAGFFSATTSILSELDDSASQRHRSVGGFLLRSAAYVKHILHHRHSAAAHFPSQLWMTGWNWKHSTAGVHCTWATHYCAECAGARIWRQYSLRIWITFCFLQGIISQKLLRLSVTSLVCCDSFEGVRKILIRWNDWWSLSAAEQHDCWESLFETHPVMRLFTVCAVKPQECFY